MAKLRTTDYNTSRPVRFARWWVAPTQVSKQSKIISGVFLSLLIIAGLVSFIFLPKTTASTAPADQAGATAAVAEPQEEASCPEAPAVQFLPEQVVNAEYQTIWVREGDMVRPTSTDGGPALPSPYPQCFSRNPEGALYSAASFATGIITATAAGDQKAFFSARCSHTGNFSVLVADLPEAGPMSNRPIITISGYRWNSYSPSTSSIEIRYSLITGPRAGELVAVTYTMAWERNDWLLVVPGKTDSVVRYVDPTRPFIPWGGTS